MTERLPGAIACVLLTWPVAAAVDEALRATLLRMAKDDHAGARPLLEQHHLAAVEVANRTREADQHL